MSKPILFCKCIYTEYIPSEAKDLFESILNSGENELLTVDDLCGLSVKENRSLIQFAEKKGVTVIACHPRAVKWLLVYSGIPNDILESINFINIYKTPWIDIFDSLSCNLSYKEKNTILVLQKKIDQCQEKDKIVDNPGTERNLALAASENSKRPWFPVIDYDRCKQCGACIDFCLFGVYEKNSDKKIEVKQPLNCKDNCPACARVCPHNAIIFTKYDRNPINGDLSEEETHKKHKPPIFSLSGEELFQSLSKRNKKSKGLYKK